MGRCYLRRIPITSGGYDRGGAYWGLGAPLWYAEDSEGEGGVYFRAASREAAKAHILARHPTVTFYR
ncbi:hypothetical protein NON00_02225 [Roseomonas sp. GC11]|uniref:hypothetical protein n=1 Tax=Roseomonas sp. GC11 TaxID=2950546 RepID=UPI002108C35A|nr:hypothetical protein [Roseomonas sp. GC11]MCQ4158743.1 hypothetical protein [Roseomonas sp. GC11]